MNAGLIPLMVPEMHRLLTRFMWDGEPPFRFGAGVVPMETAAPRHSPKMPLLTLIENTGTTSATGAIGRLGMRFHDLRDFAATELLQADQSVIDASKMLGHLSVSTTLNTYSHSQPE